ncbi:MAG: OpgC domain-containing protein, partial [Sphingomonadales bacterium]|nr:OpgC domain-containing protein [Sphingomonadales bacterium]
VRVLGRQGLPVFAFGTVLAILSQAVKEVHPGGFAQDSVLILGGLGLQYALAAIREWLRAQDRKAAAAKAAAAPIAAPEPVATPEPQRLYLVNGIR